MNSPMYEMIRRNYILGYGMPVQFYTEDQVKKLMQAGLITETECEALLEEKKQD